MNIIEEEVKGSARLLKEQLEYEGRDDFVLVFKNPFDTDHYKCTAFNETYTREEAYELFDKFFRLNDEREFLGEFYGSIADIGEEVNGEVVYPQKKLFQVVFKATIRVLEQYLLLETNGHTSKDQDEIFIRLTATDNNLKVQADIIDYQLQLKVDWEVDRDFKEVAPYGAYERQDGKSTKFIALDISTNKEDFFKRYDTCSQESRSGSIFREIDKVRIVYSMIVSALNLGKFINYGFLINIFPMHNNTALTAFSKKWVSCGTLCKRQDIESVRVYFGEKIAIYFAWLEFYTWWFVFPALAGLVLGSLFYVGDNLSNDHSGFSSSEISLLVFGILLCVMTTFLDQLWVRKQKVLAWRWGTTNLIVSEEQRPEYKGKYMKDEVSGKMKKVSLVTKWTQLRKFIGYSVILFFILLVIAILVALFLYKATLDQEGWGAKLIGVLTAVQIKVLNFIYKYVARYLTEKENHETNSLYQNSLTVKLFMFQFVNSYASLFYIAFAKKDCEGGCMSELAVQLGTICFTNLFLNFVELGTPYIMGKITLYLERRKMRASGIRGKITAEERESKMSIYEAPLDDYMEVIILYGYIVLFGVAFPFSAVLALILSIIELRVDAWKLCNLTCRPLPERAESIGVWLNILQFISIVGCGTTIAIITFTTDVFDFGTSTEKWVAFLVLEHMLIIFKIVVSIYIPDVPRRVKEGLEWSDRIMNEKLYNRYADADKERNIRNLKFEPSENARIHTVSDFLNK